MDIAKLKATPYSQTMEDYKRWVERNWGKHTRLQSTLRPRFEAAAAVAREERPYEPQRREPFAWQRASISVISMVGIIHTPRTGAGASRRGNYQQVERLRLAKGLNLNGRCHRPEPDAGTQRRLNVSYVENTDTVKKLFAEQKIEQLEKRFLI